MSAPAAARVTHCAGPFQIADRLKRKEGNANRKQQGRLGNDAQEVRQPVPQNRRDEIQVFVRPQKRQVPAYAAEQQHLATGPQLPRPQKQRDGIVEDDRGQHRQDKRRLSPRIKRKAHKQQPVVSRRSREEKIASERHGQEKEQEFEA